MHGEASTLTSNSTYPGITFSSDGTTDRAVNYESRFIMINRSGEQPKHRLISVTSSTTHKSDEQVKGTVDAFDNIASTFTKAQPINDSRSEHLTGNDILCKLTGMNSDHAEDQKSTARKLVARKHIAWMSRLGHEELHRMDPIVKRDWESAVVDAVVDRLDERNSWQEMPEAKRNALVAIEFEQRLQDLGGDMFDKLSAPEQDEIDLFVWVGCGMHKDMNCVKIAAAAMSKFWDENGLQGPIVFFNKDNSATVSLAENPNAPTAAERRAAAVSEPGGIKCCAIAGCLFNNKDDKKGYHDIHVLSFEAWFGITSRFAETSNTRFGAYTRAATQLMTEREGYIKLMVHVRDKKDSGTFNHLEANVFAGLHDRPCCTELAVLGLYGQAVSIPYIRRIRSPGLRSQNMLELGPFHKSLKTHITKLIENPELLLSPDASGELAALDGKPWHDPKLFEALQKEAPTLPHLRGALVSFLTGAYRGWERFTAEFDEDGIIASLTPEETFRAYVPATNDANEGLLGMWRVWRRRFPRLSELQFNARMMVQLNDTEGYMEKNFTEEQHKHIRQEARDPALAQAERARKVAIVAAHEAIAAKNVRERSEREAKRAARQLRAREISLELVESVIDGMKGKVLDEQLMKHRSLGEEPCLQAGYKRKEGEKTPSSMRVGEKKQFLKDMVRRYRLRHTEDDEDGCV